MFCSMHDFISKTLSHKSTPLLLVKLFHLIYATDVETHELYLSWKVVLRPLLVKMLIVIF